MTQSFSSLNRKETIDILEHANLDLLIIGGGISKESEKYIPLLKIETPIVPAQLLNEAGIIGAALAARK